MASDKVDEPFPGANRDVQVEAADLNEREKKVWDAIHETLGDKIPDSTRESDVIRFIRGYATEPDPTKAAIERLEACLKWREELKVDSILDLKLDKADVFKQCWTVGMHGKDKMGRPVYVERLGKLDTARLMENFTIEEITNFHVQMLEQINTRKEELSKEYGRRVYKHFVILDLNGFGMKHISAITGGPVREMIHIDQHYYPESLYKMVVANAPFVFRMAWAAVSPFVHPLTKERIKVDNKALKKFLDEDQIPQFLGGKCKCKDGKCLEVPFDDGRSTTK